MKPPVETVRISRQGRDQLIKLKRLTGIEHYNILCRWAFCVSLREETPPHDTPFGGEGGVDINWKIFAGEHSDTYSALVYLRVRKDQLSLDADGLTQCLRLHVHRGLGYLASERDAKSISAFLERWLRSK